MDIKERFNSDFGVNMGGDETFIYPGKHCNEKPLVTYKSDYNCDKKFDVFSYLRKRNEEFTCQKIKKFKKANHYKTKSRDIHNKSVIYRIIVSCCALTMFIVAMAGVLSGVFRAEKRSSRFAEYDNFIWPVVMQDPLPFNEIYPPDNEMVLNASVWMATSLKKLDNESLDKDGRVIVSIDEINKACSNLFGRELSFSDKNINFKKSFYEYSNEKNTFYVDCVSYHNCYVPRTVNVVDLGDIVKLKVGYIKIVKSDNPILNLKDNSVVDKYMYYTLKINKKTGQFYIYEVKNSN